MKGRLKTQDQSLHQQFDHIKKSLNHVCEDPKATQGVAATGEGETMAAINSDSNLLKGGEKSTTDAFSLSQDSYMSRGEAEQRGTGQIQRRETLATFHQYREKAAKKGRKAQSSEPEPTHYTWRKKEHIYERLDDVIGDLRGLTTSNPLEEQPKMVKKPVLDCKKENPPAKPLKTNLVKPHYHSADRLPCQYHPVPLSHRAPSKITSKELPTVCASPDNNFSSLQSADSGYNSTERVLTSSGGKYGVSAMKQTTPVSSIHGRQSTRQENVSVERMGRSAVGQKSHPAAHHVRQGSSPAYISADVNPSRVPAAPVSTQPTKLVPLSKVSSPKTKAGKSKSHKKSSGIGFLSTLNKVSGTESVSDFDFHPTVATNKPTSSNHVLRSQALSQSQSGLVQHTSRESEPVSYIGVIGPQYQHQNQHSNDKIWQPVSPNKHSMARDEKKVNFKESSKKSSKRKSSTSRDPSSRCKPKEESYSQYQSLSQPAQDDFEDSTLVLYKSKPTSYDDSGMDIPRHISSKKATPKRTSPPKNLYTGHHSHVDSRHYQKRSVFPVMEETWC